jgi:hypothetical protein
LSFTQSKRHQAVQNIPSANAKEGILSKSSKIGFLFEDSDVIKPLLSQRDLRSKNRALTLECKKTAAPEDNATANFLSTQTTQASTLLNTKKRLESGNERPSIFRQPLPTKD